MRAFRSPSHLPGLTIAGASFAAVAIIFATAGGLVAFHFQTADPSQEARPPLVLRAPQPGPTARAAVPAPARAAPSRPASPRGADPATGSPPDSVPQTAAPSPPRVVLAPGVARRQPLRQQPPPPPPPPPALPRAPQRSGPLRPVGDLVDKTTTEVARGLRATTRALAERTEFVSPAVATTVAQAGELLGDTVEGLGKALGILLGTPRDAAPGAGGPEPPSGVGDLPQPAPLVGDWFEPPPVAGAGLQPPPVAYAEPEPPAGAGAGPEPPPV
jgi:hypothetical protein